jgi:hypothetical protein
MLHPYTVETFYHEHERNLSRRAEHERLLAQLPHQPGRLRQLTVQLAPLRLSSGAQYTHAHAALLIGQ